MGKNAFRRCVICKKMEYNIDEKLFYASFPLDEKRCKDWLKLVGNPELVYLPIEKLNRVRYICGDHFIKKHFNKKGNRLKKSAIPMLNLTLPLTDQQLIEFPFHIHSDRKERIPGDVASTSRAALLSDNVNPKDENLDLCMEHSYSRKRHFDHTYCTRKPLKGSKVTLHKFPNPAKNKDMFNSWIYSIGGPILGLEDEHVFKYRRVCHMHFEDRYWCQNNRLSNIAVPTKHLPYLNIRVPIDHDYCLIEKYNPPVDSRVKKAGSLVEDLNIKHSYCRNQETSTIMKKKHNPSLGSRVKRAGSIVKGMSPVRRCLVNGCSSTSLEPTGVCWWPRSVQLQRVWIELLTPHSSRLTSSLEHRTRVDRNFCVCKLHFEEKFFNGENKRVAYSWPTLFTEEEIWNGKPKVSVTVSVQTVRDHSYAVAAQTSADSVHQERKWSKTDVVTSLNIKRTKHDHSYAFNPDKTMKLCQSEMPTSNGFYFEVGSRISAKNLDRDTNGNPDEFNAGLSNNEKDAANTGESNANKKTELDIRKSRSFDPNPYAEGIPDFDDYDDKEPSFQNLQGSKTAQDPVFSWEKTVEIVPADDGDSVACLEMEALEDLPTEISLYCDDDSSPAKLDSDKAPEYQCNECREVITGFRYTCVQCADWDLCAACEARAAHDTHYVLRVPGQRPYSEIQAVLAAIRQQILSENLFLNPVDDSLKMEIKMEPDDSPAGPENGPPTDLEVLPDLDPLPVPDPLGEQRPDSENSFTDSSEESDSDADSQIRTGTPDGSTRTDQPQTISSDDSDGSHSPLRKRMRIPNITYEKATLRRMQPVKVQENQPRPSNVEIQARGSIVTKYSQLTKVYPHQIPQKLLANIPVTGEPPAKHPYPVTVFETHPRYYQRGKSSKQPVSIEPNPASLLIQAQRVKFVEPTQSVAHQKPGTFVPQTLQHGRPRKRATENPLGSTQDPITQRTDHQRQVVASEPTEEPRKSSEQLLSEQPEFYLRLPPDTNEESLIQALQCPVSVRLKRDF